MPPTPRPAPVYIDHAATTPVREEALEAMHPFFRERFGNPSSVHKWGREARVALDEARARVARVLGARTDEICFTSGGTEADNLAVLGAWRARRNGRRAAAASAIEHKAVLGALHHVAHEGGVERMLPVDSEGVVDRNAFTNLIGDDVAVCSVMWVNNETGVVQPVRELAERAKAVGALFHTDAVQAFGKIDINAALLPFDMITVSGHKIGAPKGIGALYIRRGTPVEPLMHGGTQDRGRRPGTENVAFAVGLATAMELAVSERESECGRLRALRDALEREILDRVSDAVVHGRNSPRAPHILNVSVPGTDTESLLMALDLKGIAASGGSACQSGSLGGTHVLSAMGVEPGLAGAAVRMSLGFLTTDADIERITEVFPALVTKARSLAAEVA